MKNINAIKIGNVVKVSINNKLKSKNCGSPEEADNLFKIILKAKENPSEENIKLIHMYMNEKTRVALLTGVSELEIDPDSNEVFLSGFNTPIPMTLVEVLKDYHEKGYPMHAIINFWKLLMINPDKRVRTTLFDFISAHDFVLTDNGYMIVYKAVYRKKDNVQNNILEEYVSNQYLHVKKDWKCSPNKYVVYENFDDNCYGITKIETAESWNEKEKNVEILGKLGELYDAFINTGIEENGVQYTDMYSRTMTIELGKTVKMERKKCNSDPAKNCAYGLHCGATKYVESYAEKNSIILVCFVNPAQVIAVPESECTKMRVAEYFPFAVATYNNKKIDIIEEKYFESDFQNYEEDELKRLIAKAKANEVPYEAAINAKEEERPMSELMKILESRLVDIM